MMFRPFTLFAVLALAACGTLPEPFYGDPGKTGAILAVPPAPVLVIPTPTAALLGDAAPAYATDLATALSAQDVPAIARPGQKTDWRITTTATLTGATVTPHYTLLGPDGKTYGTQSGAPIDAAAWSDAAPATLMGQATADAAPLTKLLETANAQIQGADPNSLENRPARIYLAGVTGAPGDGNHALALNLTRDLPPLGDQLTTIPQNADFTIRATVSTAPDAKNQILVTLNWKVEDSLHRSIGQVTQLHDLSAADMTPYWGDVAAAAAAEAAGGLHEVIANATLHKPAATPAQATGH